MCRMQAALRKGTAKAWDHAQMTHSQWLKIAQMQAFVHVKRVASEDNIADPPSRCDFALMENLEATAKQPILDKVLLEASAWADLEMRWKS